MKGREPTGVSITAAIHQPAETTIDASAISRSTTRRPSFGGAATKYARPSGGTTSRTCSCLVRNPKPISAPVATIHRRRPSSIARSVVYAASVIEEHEQRVRVVEPEHQCGDGRRRHHRSRDETRGCGQLATHGGVHDPNSRDAHQRLGHEDAPRAETEHTHRQAHDPQRRGRLVDRDRARRVERSEEPGLPALRTGLRGRRVERVRPPRRAQAPEVEDRGGDQEHHERRPLPRRSFRRGRAVTVVSRRDRAVVSGRAVQGDHGATLMAATVGTSCKPVRCPFFEVPGSCLGEVAAGEIRLGADPRGRHERTRVLIGTEPHLQQHQSLAWAVEDVDERSAAIEIDPRARLS